jgi:predicted SprT family Zn-dependent metalloprotease
MPCSKKRAVELYKMHHDEVLKPLGKHVKMSFNKNKTRAAVCCFNPLAIKISEYYLESPNVGEKEVSNTILHEIAHVVAGYEAGHGPTWKKIAKKIGCNANRCTQPFLLAKHYKYTLRCDEGCVIRRHKLIRSKVYICKNHRKLMK